jgi:hypothetical protein
MKRIILCASFALLFTGCASATVHDYCSDHSGDYASYDECYSEVSQNHANWSTGKKIGMGFATLLGGSGRGVSSPQPAATITPPVICSTSYMGNTATTTCP